jgi:DNA-binding phage protein
MRTEAERADPTDNLTTPEAIEVFIEAAAETGDIVYQVDCEQIAARARKRWGIKTTHA